MSLDLRRSIVIEIDAKGAVVGARKVEDALKGIERNGKGALGKIDKEAKSASRSMDMMGTAAKAALAYLSVSTVANFAKSVLEAGVAMDSLQRSFVAISGKGAAADIAFLRGEADRLGQSFYELAPAYKQIAAAARETALEGEGVRKVFSAVAEAGAALGMSAADTEGSLRALSQMISKGTVQAEELRGQLGERLPGAFQIAAKAMGVGTKELGKMLEQGQVLSTDLLPKLATELHKTYGAAAETAGLESGRAALNRYEEAWRDLENSFYNSKMISIINLTAQAIDGLAKSIDNIPQAKFIWEGLDLDMSRIEGGNVFRGTVNRDDIRTAGAMVGGGAAAAAAKATDTASKAAERAHKKMLDDGKDAAKLLDKYWNDYGDRRVSAIADQLEIEKNSEAERLRLRMEFADKFRELTVGETAIKIGELEEQAKEYRKAGASEVAVAAWVASEKLRLATDWKSGAERSLEAYATSAQDAASLAEDAIIKGFRGMEDALVDFVATGKLSFSDFADSVIRDMARMAIQQSITGPLAGAAGEFLKYLATPKLTGSASTIAFSGVSSAKGNVFESAGLHDYVNSIVDRPTIFPFARGAGLMGEAGPEAIMPLRRGPNGMLGVEGGGSNIVINQIEAPGRGGEVQQRQENGVNVIDLFVEQIESKIAGGISQGRGLVPQAIQRTYGLNRAPGAY